MTTCRHCGDEITWDTEYEIYRGETGRCPEAPDFRHQPQLSTATAEEQQ